MYNLLSKSGNGPIKMGLTAKDIHDDFIAESDVLVDSSNKGCILAKLGFSNVKGAVPVNKYVIEEAEYFKQHYPLQRYISNEQIQHLCRKYGLVYGDASQYKGSIPDKNINEIAAFKIREEDAKSILVYNHDIREQLSFDQVPLTICAPLDDMILRWDEKVDSRGFIVKEDPIVIKPTRYGGLILSMWGPEASDPLVVNEINN
jgi:hypothetical protein